MKKNETKEIVNFIENNSSKIVKNIKYERIEKYIFMKEFFHRYNKVSKNCIFKFLYREYYGLDNIGLTPDFINEYFSIFEEYKYSSIYFDFFDVLERLYAIPNKKGLKILRFSLTTKMLNMINKNMPVYNNEVAKMFGFTKPRFPSFDKKLEIYLNQYEVIKNTYDEILSKNLLPKASLCFNERFKDYKITELNKLNFIFESAGKLKGKI